MRKATLWIVPMLLFAGCITRMSVEKVERGSTIPGMRYYLPKPLLMVNPTQDGGVDYEWVWVADETNAYAIDSRSYIAKHKVRVEVDDKGLLTKVLWNADATEPATTASNTAAELAKKRIEAEAEAAEAEAAAAKTALDAAQAAVNEAQAEVDEIDAEIAELQRQKKDDAVEEARIRRAKAKARLDAAERRLEQVLGVATRRAVAPADAPARNRRARTAMTQYGAVIFVVEDTGDKVRLRPIADQKAFDTFKKPFLVPPR